MGRHARDAGAERAAEGLPKIAVMLLLGVALASICEASAGERKTAGGTGPCERRMAESAARHGVPLGFLYAIGLTETGRRSSLHPWALNVHGRTYYPRTREEALRIFRRERARGRTLIDLGCMQINHHYHGDRFRSVEEMLDPARNVDYAARFLKRLYRREGSWTMAAARYHAGPDNDAAQKRYVCLVIRNLVASGFGRWTARARAFCGSSAGSAAIRRLARRGSRLRMRTANQNGAKYTPQTGIRSMQ